MGFDLSLKNYSGVTCEGMPPGTVIGMDGWYARGDFYAYITGEIGLFVDVWFFSGEVSILEVGAAAALDAGLPNPTWLKGAAGGYYEALGGAVKGNCHFEFSIGNECRVPEPSPIENLDIIAQLDPHDGETDVDTYINPLAAFNIEINKELQFTQTLDGGSIQRNFRFSIDKFELKQGSQIIPVQIQNADDKLSSVILPFDMLKPRKPYNVTIKIKAEEYNFTTRTWALARKTNGDLITAELSHNFTTGDAPDYIPSNQVAYSFPLFGQRFFLKDECDQGIILLKAGRPDLFSISESGYTISYLVRFIPVDGGVYLESAAEYHSGSKSVSFQLPAIQNSTIYAVQLIRKKERIRTPGDLIGGILPTSRSPLTNPVLTEYLALREGVQIRNQRIDGRRVSNANENLYYVFFFRSSSFSSLQAKLNSISNSSTNRDSRNLLFLLIENLLPQYSTTEKFDIYDVNGFNYRVGFNNYKISPLIRTLDGLNNSWYNTFAKPDIYDYYNTVKNYTSVRMRTAMPEGIPPINTVTIMNPQSALTEAEYLPSAPSSANQYSNVLSDFGSGFLGGVGTISFGGSSYSPTISMRVTTATTAWVDYTLLNLLTSDVMRRLGHPRTSEFYTEPLKSQMLRYLNSSWRPLYRGPYRLKFYYNPPNCYGPDDFAPVSEKTYTY